MEDTKLIKLITQIIMKAERDLKLHSDFATAYNYTLKGLYQLLKEMKGG